MRKSIIIEINTESKFSKLAQRTAEKLAHSLKNRASVTIDEIEYSNNEKVYVL